MSGPHPASCPACGAAASGKYCSNCGAPLGPRACAHCGAELSAAARFCHRCGRPAVAAAARRSERGPWLVAAALVVLAIGAILLKVWNGARPPAAPDMANAGAQSAAPFASGGAPAGPAPDISQMSPRERFDRLFNRVMSAAERGDSATVLGFTPMALGAYSQLDSVDADARYHAAVLHTQVGEFNAARALADSILASQPGHLFGYLVRGAVAQLQNDDRVRRQAYRDFLAHYDAEMAAGRPEYNEHRPALEQFRAEAKRAAGG